MKLLRVLETGGFQRLGSNKERKVKVRIVSATNADLRALIRGGQFREDLFYRLNAIELALPPLAERPDDILPLAEHFLPPGKQLGDDAARALLAYRGPATCANCATPSSAPRCSVAAGARAADLGLPRRPRAIARAARRANPTARRSRRRCSAAAAWFRRQRPNSACRRQALYRRMDRFGISARASRD